VDPLEDIDGFKTTQEKVLLGSENSEDLEENLDPSFRV